MKKTIAFLPVFLFSVYLGLLVSCGSGNLSNDEENHANHSEIYEDSVVNIVSETDELILPTNEEIMQLVSPLYPMQATLTEPIEIVATTSSTSSIELSELQKLLISNGLITVKKTVKKEFLFSDELSALIASKEVGEKSNDYGEPFAVANCTFIIGKYQLGEQGQIEIYEDKTGFSVAYDLTLVENDFFNLLPEITKGNISRRVVHFLNYVDGEWVLNENYTLFDY